MTCNLGQNKMEQQTPIPHPPPPQIKHEAAIVQDCSFQEPARLKFSPHIRESMTVLDSNSFPWIPDPRHWIPIFVSRTCILDSNR